ncbi:uncharacterized protein LOC143295868 isoform X2 [Babylonia areolata]|uniref:uncharacterized protein LOC143295868 isoform X2 n=1 Tax=Babylonia areolata TaxID=304850 RepID=UPI003FD6827F
MSSTMQTCPTMKKVFFIISVVAFGLVWLAGTWHPDWDYKRQYASFTESMARAVPPSFRYEPLNATEKVDPETEELLKVLLKRLQRYTGPKLEWTKYVCHKYVENIAPCYDTTCPGQFSPSLRTRLKQVLATRSPIPAQYLQALASAAQSVTPHKYIFATGTSSNHFREMELFLHTALTSLLPRMEGKDFALLVYDLGLTTEQRERLQKICRCTVLDFPFSGLPDFVSELKCYTWKPLIIASLLEKAEYLTWATPPSDSETQTRSRRCSRKPERTASSHVMTTALWLSAPNVPWPTSSGMSCVSTRPSRSWRPTSWCSTTTDSRGKRS